MLQAYNLQRPITQHNVTNDDAIYSIAFNPFVTPTTANVYTSYATIISEVPFDSYGFSTLDHHNGLGNYARTLYQMATGASGSETRLLEFGGFFGDNAFEVTLGASLRFWPMFLSKGTRVSFRGKMDRLGTDPYLRMGIEFYRSPPLTARWVGSKAYTYGLDETNLLGTAVAPSETADVWGSWTEITAATSVVHKALAVSTFAPTNYPNITAGYTIQIGVGASGQEQIISPPLRLTNGGSGLFSLNSIYTTIYRTIASGARLSARAMGNTSSLTSPLVFIHGIS
jgi:hypothetical protein